MMLLFRRWLGSGGKTRVFSEAPANPPKTLAYAVINNLIRVIRNGREIKMHVDIAIQQCAGVYNLTDSIEDARQEADDASDSKRKESKIRRGTDDLRRYFMLVLFASWLNESSADSVDELRGEQSFERFVGNHPVFQTIHKEIDAAGPAALEPLGQSSLTDGVASDEVENVVAMRNGRILSASTILKSYVAQCESVLYKLNLPIQGLLLQPAEAVFAGQGGRRSQLSACIAVSRTERRPRRQREADQVHLRNGNAQCQRTTNSAG